MKMFTFMTFHSGGKQNEKAFAPWLVAILLLMGALSTPALAAPTIDNNAGLWVDNFFDPLGTENLNSNNMAFDVVAGTISLDAGQNAGNQQTVVIAPPSFDAWEQVCLDATFSANTDLRISILDASNNSVIPGYANLDMSTLDINGCLDISGISATTYPEIKVRIDHIRGTTTPLVKQLQVKWNPLTVLLFDKEAPVEVLAGQTFRYKLRISANFVNARDVVLYDQLPRSSDNTVLYETGEYYGIDDDPIIQQILGGGVYTATATTVRGVAVPANSVYWEFDSIPAGRSSILELFVSSPNGTLDGTIYENQAFAFTSNGASVSVPKAITEIRSRPAPNLAKAAPSLATPANSQIFPVSGVNYVLRGSTITFTLSDPIGPLDGNNFAIEGRERMHNTVLWDNLDELVAAGILNGAPTNISGGGVYTTTATTVNGVNIPANSIYWNLGVFQPGATFRESFSVSISNTAALGTYTNFSYLDSDQTNVISDALPITVADDLPPCGIIGCKKGIFPTYSAADQDNNCSASDGSKPVLYGDPIQYQFGVGNCGAGTLRNIVMYDQVPPEVTFVSASFNDPANLVNGSIYYYVDLTGTYSDPETPPLFDWTNPTSGGWSATAPVDTDQPNQTIWVVWYAPAMTSSLFNPNPNLPVKLDARLDVRMRNLNTPCEDTLFNNTSLIQVFGFTSLANVLEDAAFNQTPLVSGTATDKTLASGPKGIFDADLTVLNAAPVLTAPDVANLSLTVLNRNSVSSAPFTNVEVVLTWDQLMINGVAEYPTYLSAFGGTITQLDPANGTVKLNLGSMLPGDQRQVLLNLGIPRGVIDEERLTVRAELTGSDNACAPQRISLQRSQVLTAQPAVQVFKDDILDVIPPGGTIEYELNYRNLGQAPATGSWVVDRIPFKTVFLDARNPKGSEVWFTDKLPPAMPANQISVANPVDFSVIQANFSLGIRDDKGTPGDPTDDVWTSPFGDQTTWVAFLVDAPSFTPPILPISSQFCSAFFRVKNDEDGTGPGTAGSPEGTIIFNEEVIFTSQNLQAVGNEVVTTIEDFAGLELVKTSNLNEVTSEEPFEWIIEYYNNSAARDDVVRLTDQLPAGVILDSIRHEWNDTAQVKSGLAGGLVNITSSSSVTLTPQANGGTTVEVNVAGSPGLKSDLLSQEGGRLVLYVKPPPATPSGTVLLNKVTGFANNPGGPVSVTDDDIVTVTNPDLSLNKSVSKSDPAPGERITYTLVLSNEGLHSAANVRIADTLPSGATYVSGSTQILTPGYALSEPTTAGQILNWDDLTQVDALGAPIAATGLLPALSPDVFISYQVDIAGVSGDVLTNRVGTSTSDPEEPVFSNQSSSTVSIPFPDPGVQKSGPALSEAGDNIVWTIRYRNESGLEAQDVYLVETLPDTDGDNSTEVTFVNTVANGPGAVSIFYNAASGPAPAFTPATPNANGWSSSPTSPVNHIAYSVGSLPANAGPFTIQLTTQLQDPGGTLPLAGTVFDNQVEIFTSSTENNLANNSASASTRIPGVDLSLSKVGSVEGAFPGLRPGDDITYSFTVRNEGSVTAFGVSISDTLPASFVPDPANFSDFGLVEITDGTGAPLSLLDASENPLATPVNATLSGTPAGGATLTWFVGSDNPSDPDYYRNVGLPVDAELTFTIRGSVLNTAPDGQQIRNEAEVVYEGLPGNIVPEEFLSNNPDASTTFIYRPEVNIIKSVQDVPTGDETWTEAGNELLYTLQYQNSGNADADQVCIEEIIPVGTSYVPGSITTPQGVTLTFRPDANNPTSFEACMDLLPAPANFDSEFGTTENSVSSAALGVTLEQDPNFYSFTQQGAFQSNNDFTRDIDFGDVDGDGDLDAVVANWSNRQNILYINNGSGMFTQRAAFGTGFTNQIDLADVDGDGDLDALAADAVFSNGTILYLNDGNGNFTAASPFSPPRTGYDVEFADVDGDGDLDMATVGTLENNLYFNNGPGNPFTRTITFAIPSVPVATYLSQDIEFGDLDGDGDLDAVVANLTPGVQNYLFFNNGSGGFTNPTAFGTASSTYGLDLGDVDGDGDLDVVVANDMGGQNYLYLNDGSGGLTEQAAFGMESTRDIDLGDIDNDGDLDAVVANNFQNYIYINDGGGGFTQLAALGSGPSFEVELGDVNGDGRLDVAVSNGNTTNLLFINTTGIKYSTSPKIVDIVMPCVAQLNKWVVLQENANKPAGTTITYTLYPEDVDGDGDCSNNGPALSARTFPNGAGQVDISAIDASTNSCLCVEAQLDNTTSDNTLTPTLNSLRLEYSTERDHYFDGASLGPDAESDCGGAHLAPRLPWYDNSNSIQLSLGNFNAIKFGDVDGDGDLDAVGAAFGNNSLYRNDGSGNFTRSNALGNNTDFDVELGDMDGDGDLDAVVTSTGRASDSWFRNDGSGNFTRVSYFQNTNQTYQAAIGDIDGDGDLDIAIARSGLNPILINDGSGVFTNATFGSTSTVTYDIEFGDVDGDGDLDAVLANNGENELYLNDGSGDFTLVANALGSPASTGVSWDVALGDLDGDGDLDVVTAEVGQNLLYFNDGSGGFGTGQLLPGTGATTLSLSLGDLDGDGALDIVEGNGNTSNPSENPDNIYFNDGRGSFSVVRGLGSGRTWGNAVGDVDGDGDLDVAIANFGGTSLFLQTPPYDPSGTFATPIFSEGNLSSWDRLLANEDLPEGTDITYSLYTAGISTTTGCTGTPLSAHQDFSLSEGFRDISDIDPANTELCMQVNLASNGDQTQTPCLEGWTATYLSDTVPTITFRVRVDNPVRQGQNRIENTVNISTPTPEIANNTANNQADDDISIRLTDVAIEKIVDKASIDLNNNETLTYTLNWEVLGPQGAVNTVVSDVLPAGVNYQSASPLPSQTFSIAGGRDSLVWQLPASLSAGSSGSIVVTATESNASLGDNLLNLVKITNDRQETDLSNNQDDALTVATLLANVYIQKTGPSVLDLNQTGQFTLSYGNNGALDAQNVTLIDVFPTGLTPVSTNHAACSVSGQTVSCSFGTLPAGSTGTVVVDFTVGSSPALVNRRIFNNASIATTSNEVLIFDNEDDHAVDIRILSLSSLSGTVWQDDNRNGQIDLGESGIQGVTMVLTGTDILGNSVIQTANTDINGDYSFLGLVPGTYNVEQVQPVGYLSTTTTGTDGVTDIGDVTNGSPTGTIPDVGTVGNGSSATTNEAYNGISLAGGERGIGYNFGEALGSIGDLVWQDLNGNGIREAGDVGIGGITVRLYEDGGDGIVNSGDEILRGVAQTDALGQYQFDGLLAGDYYVDFDLASLPVGLNTVSPRNVAGAPTNNDDSDADPTTGLTDLINIAAGDVDLSWDMGVSGSFSVGNRIWFDLDNNGILDGGEQGIDGVAVALYWVDGAGNRSLLTQTVTQDGGYYVFPSLVPGDYEVILPASNFATGQPLNGYNSSGTSISANGTLTETPATDPDDDRDSDVDENGTRLLGGALNGAISSGVITLGQFEPTSDDDFLGGTLSDPAADNLSNYTVDFGFYSMRLGNLVWNDLNNNGLVDTGEPRLSGVTVELLSADGSTVLDTDVTNGNGVYRFDGLAEGDYLVRVTPPAGFASSSGQVGSGTGPYEPGVDTDLVSINNDDNGSNGTGANAGFVLSEPVTMDAGNEHGTDLATGITIDRRLDFGLLQTMSLGNMVFLDDDLVPGPGSTANNGIMDAGESGIDGVVLNLYADPTGTGTPASLLSTTTTANGGFYLFENLIPGDYVVEVDASNFGPGGILGGTISSVITDGNPNSNVDQSDNGLDDPDPAVNGIFSGSINLAYGAEPTTESPLDPINGDGLAANNSSNMTLDFGFVGSGALGNRVWIDANENGLQDVGEVGQAGVDVTLFELVTGSAPVLIGTETTNSDGFYLFEDLSPNRRYYLEFSNLPAGYEFTTPQVGPNDTIDSDPLPLTGRTTPILLAPRGVDTTWDAGIFLPKASIGDYVWEDLNENGYREGGEPPIPGVRVVLYNANGDSLDQTFTNPQGVYLFDELTPGDYYVRFAELPTGYEGYVLSPQDNAPNDIADSDADPLTGETPVTNLAPGENDVTWDAGFYLPKASLGDRVWEDENEDGIQDAGENGVPGVRVVLFDAAGNRVDSTLTDGQGNYLFEELTPGDYTVQFKELPRGYLVSPKDATNDADDSDANPNGFSDPVTLGPGEENLDVDAGIYLPKASIGDLVWDDLDQDGERDAGEPGVGGVRVILRDGTGAFVSTTTTRPDGSYSFTGLTPGDYSLAFGSLPTGYVFSPQDAAADNVDSDADPNTGRTITTTLDPGENDVTWDAGIYLPKASLGDRVWEDINENGIQDAGEQGVQGIEVVLLDGNGIQVRTTQTDAQGTYLFDNLIPGEYSVEFRNLPAGYVFSPQDATNDANDSDADPNTGRTATTTLDPGENDLSLDAGIYLPKASIGNRVWYDDNENGVQDPGEAGVPGARVNLYKSDGTFVGQTNTDLFGHYGFTHLTPGDYYVEIPVLLPGYVFSPQDNATNDQDDSDVDPNTGRMATTTLDPGEHDADWDAGIYIPKGSLGDRVWYDTDEDGEQDGGEMGVSGVTVALYDGNGNLLKSTTTDGQGNYLFDGLLPGDYQVGFELPTGYERSPQDAVNDNDDSDADPITGRSPVVSLSAGEDNLTVDAGIYEPKASLGDRVWEDTDKDGEQDAGENGVANVRVVLYNCAGDSLDQTFTGANGDYLFGNLVPGDYYVIFKDQPMGYSFSPQDAVAADDRDSDADPSGQTACVTLAPGEDERDLDAGLIPPTAELGDKVWEDLDEDGMQDPNEPGVPNVRVVLYSCAGDSLDQQFTGADGEYLFTNLPAGDYYVAFRDLPADYSFTAQDMGNDDSNDSDADVNTGETACITLAPGESNRTPDAGISPDRLRVCEAEEYGPSGFAMIFTNGMYPAGSREYVFDSNGGEFITYANGTARLTGTVVSKTNNASRFRIDARFINRKDWGQWSALGRQAKGANLGPFQTWEFYEIDSLQSRLIGEGNVAGDTFHLSHMPVSRMFGPQVGDGANDRNGNYGMSGWWFFTSTSGTYAGGGDFNVTLENCLDVNTPVAPKMGVVAVLEGPYEPSTGVMRTDLNSQGLLPLQQPFSQAPWNYSGTEAVSAIPSAEVVDWVLVEVRDVANPATILSRQAAFMLEDGQVVGLDGHSLLDAPQGQSSFRLVIHNWNHLPVMSAGAVTKYGNVFHHDFSQGLSGLYQDVNVANPAAAVGAGGISLLIEGDATGDQQINSLDLGTIMQQYFNLGRAASDTNLDGVINSLDVGRTMRNYFKQSHVPK